MIRGILRNVQYLFLFFSVLLVFLALQRLQYLPQHYDNYSIIAGVGTAPSSSSSSSSGGAKTTAASIAAEFDKPLLLSLSSSEELKPFYYYRGDETKEIGLRSFRVGVFKFILPSFSSSSSSSSASYKNENNNYNYLTVPPPNDKPNNNNKSVAYILDISSSKAIRTRQSPSASSSIDTTTTNNNNTTIANNVQTLSKSIQRIHDRSKYTYKLYALVKSTNEFVTLDKRDGDGSSGVNWLSKLGFEIIDSTTIIRRKDEQEEEEKGGGSIAPIGEEERNTRDNKQLYKVWRRHDVIINLRSGINLHSSWTLDGLFDILVSKKSNRRFPGIDSFLLQPYYSSHTSKRREEKEEILILDGNSHRAFETCVQFLSCVTAPDKTSTNVVLDVAANKEEMEEEEESKIGNGSHRCMDEIDSNRGLAKCTYHEDFIDCSESMLAKDAT